MCVQTRKKKYLTGKEHHVGKAVHKEKRTAQKVKKAIEKEIAEHQSIGLMVVGLTRIA